MRWRHPARGHDPAGEFIPLVEQSYLMRDLTRHVVDMALAQAALWWRDGLAVPVSLNVGARDLLDSGLAETVGRGLARTGLPPEAILLEINERVLTSEPAHAAAAADSLAALGVALSLDDFGTGHSSLVWLRQLPVSEVKIDPSFVRRLLDSAEDEVIVRSIVDLVHALGIRSVAEGVESAQVAAALQAMGCDAAQGWYFGRPLSPALATAWLAQHAAGDHAGTGCQPPGARPSCRPPGPSASPAASPACAGASAGPRPPRPAPGQRPGQRPGRASRRSRAARQPHLIAPARNAVGVRPARPIGWPPCLLPARRSPTWPRCRGWPCPRTSSINSPASWT